MLQLLWTMENSHIDNTSHLRDSTLVMIMWPGS